MITTLDPSSLDDYRTFLRVKSLPQYRFVGRSAVFPDEYATRVRSGATVTAKADGYTPLPGLFDYQRDIAAMAIRKRKFAAFADCGLGKTLIMLEFARHARAVLPARRGVLIVSPLMVIPQTLAEAARFYGDSLPIRQLVASELQAWLIKAEGVAIVNYDAMHSGLRAGRLGALILDESSMLKSHYGQWGQACVRLGRGLHWKLALTGTPAPNDRIEYANHAVFLNAFPTVNAFLARYFVNRGQTDNRWELKPHALRPFYRSLSHWSIFLSNPAVYGWKDNAQSLPPIVVHMHDVALTREQQELAYGATGSLFADRPGGITSRSVLSQIAKGNHRGQPVATNKPDFIRSLVASWPEESTLIWCLFNEEQRALEKTLPDAASIAGDTPLETRLRLIEEFKSGRRRVLISKPKILGFGLNLQVATRRVFSGLQDSYESYYQAVKRSNRYGATRPLNVHIPVTDIERPMIETVLAKAARVQRDTEEQERIFRDATA